jgi:hypothetical protein
MTTDTLTDAALNRALALLALAALTGGDDARTD